MKLIILDRDGVINEDSDEYIKSPDEFVPIPGSLEAIARLKHAGYTVVVATNQSGIARKLFDIGTLNAIHAKLQRELARFGVAIDAIFFCPHGPDDRCTCRKPKPGLFHDIGARLQTQICGVPCIGDSLRDVEAAREVDARPMLVRTGKGAGALARHADELRGVPVFDTLADAVDALLDTSPAPQQ